MHKLLLFILLLSFTPNLGLCQLLPSDFEKGDTMWVFTPKGVNLREAPTQSSKKIRGIPYGEPLVVISENFEAFEEFEHRWGGWIKVSIEGKEGYVFGGYLTDKKLPKFSDQKQDCVRVYGFEDFFRMNIGDTILAGIDTFNYFGKPSGTDEWVLFDHGNEMHYLLSNENLDLVIETHDFKINDLINYLESYIFFSCQKDLDSIKIDFLKDEDGSFIDGLKCDELWFYVEWSFNKLRIMTNIYNL